MVSEMSNEREILDYSMYGNAVRELAQQVADDGYRPEMILAIARGGLLVAGSLGYAMSVKNICHELRVLHRRRRATSGPGHASAVRRLRRHGRCQDPHC